MEKYPSLAGVYIVEDFTSGDTYIGSTNSLRDRWTNLHNSRKLRISKHLREHPDHVVGMRLIEEVSGGLKERKAAEQRYIVDIHPSLNVSTRSNAVFPHVGRAARGPSHWHNTPVTSICRETGKQTTFPSLLAASAVTGVRHQYISAAIRGVKPAPGGFQWRYTHG